MSEQPLEGLAGKIEGTADAEVIPGPGTEPDEGSDTQE